MKLYHGSPKKLDVLVPSKARGISKFENQKAIFLVKTFRHAALYAIGKTLKGKTSFAISKNKLLIAGEKKPKKGFVYKVDVKAKKGQRGQYSYYKPIKKFVIYEVFPRDYEKSIAYVKNKKEMMRLCNLS